MFIQQKIMFMNTRKCVDIFQSTKTVSYKDIEINQHGAQRNQIFNVLLFEIVIFFKFSIDFEGM